MSAPKQPYRKRHLFARSLDEVVKNATKPMLDKQGKLYGALLANWRTIVGEARAEFTRPGRLQFPAKEATGAILHLDVHPAKAPELHYEQEQMLEQCARHFGYRAITRIVLHPAHDLVKPAPNKTTETKVPPQNMRDLLQRMKSRITKDANS